MSKQPFLPLFFGDFLASTAAWEGEERALYILLLAYQWTSGPLPSDPKRLARMCQFDPKTFAKLWPVVGAKFEETEGGLVNARLEEHREKSREIGAKRAELGRRGGLAKARAMASKGPAIATDLPEPISTIHPIPSHIPVDRSSPDTHLSATPRERATEEVPCGTTNLHEVPPASPAMAGSRPHETSELLRSVSRGGDAEDATSASRTSRSGEDQGRDQVLQPRSSSSRELGASPLPAMRIDSGRTASPELRRPSSGSVVVPAVSHGAPRDGRITRGTHFAEFRAAYPDGTYTESAWLLGERAYLRCIETESTHAELMPLVRAYAEQQRAKGAIRTQFVRTPANFFADQFWRGPFPMPKTKAQAAQDANVDASLTWLAEQEARDAAG